MARYSISLPLELYIRRKHMAHLESFVVLASLLDSELDYTSPIHHLIWQQVPSLE